MPPWCRRRYTKGAQLSTELRSRAYYSRLLVPVALRGIFGRLGTAVSDACIKACVWEGHLSRLFVFLKEHHRRMTAKEIERLIEHYISSTLKDCEEERLNRAVSEDEREAIGLTLVDLMENTHAELVTHDYRRISRTANELLETIGLQDGGRTLGCRLLLLAFGTSALA